MTSSRFASLLRSTAFLGLPAFIMVAACNGNVVVEEPGTTATTSGSDCDDGELACDGVCVDPLSDPSNCGACAVICSQGPCSSGKCLVPGCPPGLSLCGDLCTDLANDLQHCGSCDHVCPTGSQCFGGSCLIAECQCGSLCEITSLGSMVPQSVSGPSAGLIDQIAPFCSGGGGVDVTFSFFPPEDGTYTFDTFGSDFDTVLQVMDGGCSPVGCNDDSGNTSASSVTVFIPAGQQVLVVIDVLAGSGDYQLNITSDKQGGCVSCGDFISGAGPDQFPCDGLSSDLYNKLIDCICSGACSDKCQPACNGDELDTACSACIGDTVNGCGNQYNECANDF